MSEFYDKGMDEFDKLWQFVIDRSQRGVMTVQEKSELEHVFNLMKGCDCRNYLEVGTAEGNSLYVLGHAVNKSIYYIDLMEPHTETSRSEVEKVLLNGEKFVIGIDGDSTERETSRNKDGTSKLANFDCILIDGGHDFATVLSDSILYAPLATKYIFWHDIQLLEVKAAVEWFVKRWKLGKYSTFINSESFGYGICEVGK